MREPRDRVLEILNTARRAGRNWLLEHEAKEVCSLYRLPVTRLRLVRTPEEAVKAAEEIGYPVVLKIVSPQVIHKSDVGGVKLGLSSPDEVVGAFREIIDNVRRHVPNAEITGILVQEMAPQSTEVIIGVVNDPQFGHTVMFGLGGVFVELFEDVSFRVTPLTRRDAEEMVREVKAYRILRGYRGLPPADIDAIIDALLRVSMMVEENPEIDQMDLNPIMVYEKGLKVVDARIIFK